MTKKKLAWIINTRTRQHWQQQTTTTQEEEDTNAMWRDRQRLSSIKFGRQKKIVFYYFSTICVTVHNNIRQKEKNK